MSEVRIAFVGSGASNVACSRLIFGWGADPAKCFMVDSKGILGKHRRDLEMRKAEYVDKWRLCQITNEEGREGDIPDAMRGADVVIGLSRSGPGVILPEWVEKMNKDAIVFACANPVPEIWPWEAKAAGARIMATGRSDFPNQVNNSLGFPGIFRGALDVRARTITDEMCFAAAEALANHVGDKLDEEYILPGADIVAVIRSTAQSLLDYVPHGATTEGYGGTYATQENFRIMRGALDEESRRPGRYLQLTNYSSGLCMPEIAFAAAWERLDMLLNDAMYGILFRDINMKRTLCDQYFSRRICALAEITINTGEDNYITTADADEAAHSVVASQFVNQSFARRAGLPDRLLGLGHSFEIDPARQDTIAREIAQALLVRTLFPDSPIKSSRAGVPAWQGRGPCLSTRSCLGVSSMQITGRLASYGSL